MSEKLTSHTIGLIGGDKRISILASIMKNNGCKVKVFGLVDEEDFDACEVCSSSQEIYKACDVIVLPVPVSRDKITLFAEKQGVDIKLADMLGDMSNFGSKFVLGGIIPKDFCSLLKVYGHTAVDIFENKELIQKNAIATAEGALMIAMEKMDSTVVSSNFGILGFGRIASHLAKIVSSLGGNVTVFARRDEVIAEASALGYKTFRLSEDYDENYVSKMAEMLDSFSVIFNTIPSVVIDSKIISKMCCRPIYIELASYPYGINTKDAREQNFNTVYAPSLPGRYSPCSAAQYLFEAINYYLT